MDINPAYLFFYGATIFFYVADALQKSTSLKFNTWSYIKKRSYFTAPVAIIASIIITQCQHFPSFNQLLKLVGSSAICAFGLFYYIKAVNHAHFSNIGSLSIVGNVFQWLIGWLIFSDKISWLDLPAMFLMFSGCLIQLFSSKLSKGAFYVMACSFFWVIGYSILSNYLKEINVFWSIPIMEITILVMSLLFSMNKKEVLDTNSISRWKLNGLLLMIALFIYLGSTLNHFLYQKIPLSTISLLQLSMMPLGYIVSLKIFREKSSLLEWVSFFLGLIGFAYLHFIRNHYL